MKNRKGKEEDIFRSFFFLFFPKKKNAKHLIKYIKAHYWKCTAFNGIHFPVSIFSYMERENGK